MACERQEEEPTAEGLRTAGNTPEEEEAEPIGAGQTESAATAGEGGPIAAAEDARQAAETGRLRAVGAIEQVWSRLLWLKIRKGELKEYLQK